MFLVDNENVFELDNATALSRSFKTGLDIYCTYWYLEVSFCFRALFIQLTHHPRVVQGYNQLNRDFHWDPAWPYVELWFSCFSRGKEDVVYSLQNVK